MNISIASVVPDIYKNFVDASIIKKAREKGLLNLDVEAYFSFVRPKERIDAPCYGHGPGMLIKPKVIQKAIEEKEKAYGKAFKVFFSPQGKTLDQRLVQKIARKAMDLGHLMLLPARYEGMDARIEERYADEVVSVGDFVLMGGDLPAMMLVEAIARYIPGVVGKEESVQDESFSGSFVEYPQYTVPVVWQDMPVPEIIRSGNHGAIDKWHSDEAAKRTVFGHFSWLRSSKLSQDERNLASKYIPSHYCALMHEQVLVGSEKRRGTTSVTSFDLHDIARSSHTYGFKRYFIVTPLIDQQCIVKRLLHFWHTDGRDYNEKRYQAVKNVVILNHLNDVIEAIKEKEKKEPIIVATSARAVGHARLIGFYDQEVVWRENRPVLFVFGTGQGLEPAVLERADYLLKPVEGFSDYNHLSVRSAAAIIFDRWLGISEKER